MSELYELGVKSWGGRGEHGFVNATVVQQEDSWQVIFQSEDYNDWGGKSTLTGKSRKTVTLVPDYFEKYSADDFRILLDSLGYYRISEEELLDKLIFCRIGMKNYAVEYFSPKNVVLKEFGIMRIEESKL